MTGAGPSDPYPDTDGTGRYNNAICETTVVHDMTIVNSPTTASEWILGELTGTSGERENECLRSDTIQHDLNVTGNHNDALDIGENQVGHTIDVTGNQPTSTDVYINNAGHDANCSNDGPPDGNTGGNTAGHSNSGCG